MPKRNPGAAEIRLSNKGNWQTYSPEALAKRGGWCHKQWRVEEVVRAEHFHCQLTDLLNRVGYRGDAVIVERNGCPIAVLRPYEPLRAALERSQNAVEQVPMHAVHLEAAGEAAGLSYEELARQLQAERFRTLYEKYAQFAAEFDDVEATAPA